MSIQLSIIIPVYNVENYLQKCLNSIFNTTIRDTDFEVIAINDGSSDFSLEILNENANKLPNLHVINQSNHGVSFARNVGLNYARGKYITFIDADDWISNSSLKKIIEFLSSDNIDALVVNSIQESSGILSYDWKSFIKENHPYSGLELFENFNYIRGSVCGVFYNLNFLKKHKLFFPEGISNSEDSIFFARFQTFAKKILFRSINFYFIYSRNNSASRCISTKMLTSYRKALECVSEYSNQFRNDKVSNSIVEYEKILIFTDYVKVAVLTKIGYKKSLDNGSIISYLPVRLSSSLIKKKSVKIRFLILNTSYFMFYVFISVYLFLNKFIR